MKKYGEINKSGIELAEEAISMVRRAPLDILASYYVGSLPFLLGLLTFWATMERSATAYRSLPCGALIMALLFIWLKVWQTRYCVLLNAWLQDLPAPAWTLRRWVQCAMIQTPIQASGFILLPLATLTAIPMAWVYALYQNASVLDDGSQTSARTLFNNAMKQARLWPAQNHILIWLLSPYLLMLAALMFLVMIPVVGSLSPVLIEGVVYIYAGILAILLMPLTPFAMMIAVNLGLGILLLVSLIQILTGSSDLFLSFSTISNSDLYLAMICGLTYLCLDPLIKAAYVLRCFYGRTLCTGEDLRVQLRRYGALLVLAGCLSTGAVTYAESEPVPASPVINAQQLDQALDQELSQWRYTWRMPRELPNPENDGFFITTLRNLNNSIQHAFATIRRWMDRLFKRWFDSGDDSEKLFPNLSELSFWLRAILLLLCVLLAGFFIVFLIRLWKIRRSDVAPLEEIVSLPPPDIADESVLADQLPEDEWVTLARNLFEQGQYRLAVRALFLATLSSLARSELIRIARHKSNLDYIRELQRRGTSEIDAAETFRQSACAYESVWYGTHDPTPALYHTLEACQERLRGHAVQ